MSGFSRRCPLQKIREVQHFDVVRASLAQAGPDLQDAARVGCHHDLRAGFQNVPDLSALQPRGHFRFGQVVTSRAAAAHIRFRQLDKAFARRGAQQVSRRLRDVLRMCEVTGLRPVVDRVVPLAEAREGFRRLMDEDLFGKVVLDVSRG